MERRSVEHALIYRPVVIQVIIIRSLRTSAPSASTTRPCATLVDQMSPTAFRALPSSLESGIRPTWAAVRQATIPHGTNMGTSPSSCMGTCQRPLAPPSHLASAPPGTSSTLTMTLPQASLRYSPTSTSTASPCRWAAWGSPFSLAMGVRSQLGGHATLDLEQRRGLTTNQV